MQPHSQEEDRVKDSGEQESGKQRAWGSSKGGGGNPNVTSNNDPERAGRDEKKKKLNQSAWGLSASE